MTIFKDEFCQEPMMAQNGAINAHGFLAGLKESSNPSEDVKSFLARIRETTSVLGSKLAKNWILMVPTISV